MNNQRSKRQRGLQGAEVMNALREAVERIHRDHAEVLKTVKAFAGVADLLEGRIAELERQLASISAVQPGITEGEPATGGAL